MEIAVTALHRTMRIAELLVDSRTTAINEAWLPSQEEREELRSMRNAIDHIEGSIGMRFE